MSVATLEPKTAPAPAVVQAKSPESQFERYDTIDTSKIVVIGVISAILTFCTVLAAQALYYSANQVELNRKESVAATTPLTEGLTQQQNRLGSYGWVDQAKGIVNIPVGNAMKLVVAEHAK